MNLKTCCAFLGASLFIAPNLFAQLASGSLSISAPNYNGSHPVGDQAGPYVVVINSVSTGSGVTAGETFQTFCIGSQVDYDAPGTYNYAISKTVQPSSVGVTYVTWGTAYLYNEFLNGVPGYGFGGNTTTVASSTADETLNDALQVAIWELQGQSLEGITLDGGISATTFTNTLADKDLVNQFLTDAATAAGSNSDTNNANGAFGIYALNMSYTDGTPAQPELVRVIPEPSTIFAGILLLAPLGLTLLRQVRTLRKQRQVCLQKIRIHRPRA